MTDLAQIIADLQKILTTRGIIELSGYESREETESWLKTLEAVQEELDFYRVWLPYKTTSLQAEIIHTGQDWIVMESGTLAGRGSTRAQAVKAAIANRDTLF